MIKVGKNYQNQEITGECGIPYTSYKHKITPNPMCKTLCHASMRDYQSSPSRSLAGTSMTRGLSMMRAVRLPFSTMPMIQAW